MPPRSARRFWLLALLGLTTVAATAVPADAPFSFRRLRTLQAENALILVAATAPGLPACSQQRDILRDFQIDHPETGLKILWVDYEQQKRELKYLNISLPGTLILYRGTERRWASVSEMNADVIGTAILRVARE